MAERVRNLAPPKKMRPPKGHPWRSRPIKTRLYNPVHIGGYDDDDIFIRQAGMAEGCCIAPKGSI